jgi:hypothetical protein
VKRACLITPAALLLWGIAAHAEEPPPVVAEFRTTTCSTPCRSPQVRHWFLLRDVHTVELRDARLPVSQLWQRDGHGATVRYSYAMHDEKRAVDYTSTDLALIRHTPSWERLGSILTADEVASLTPVAGEQMAGGVTLHRGSLEGAHVELQWNRPLALPQQVRFDHPTHTLTMELLRSFDHPGPVPATTPAVLAGYARVDFADLGDMEHDAAEQRWIRKALLAPGHVGHDHRH